MNDTVLSFRLLSLRVNGAAGLRNPVTARPTSARGSWSIRPQCDQEAGPALPSHHHAQVLALISEQAPDRAEEFAAYEDDPIVFAALVISAEKAGELDVPPDLLALLREDLTGFEPAAPTGTLDFPPEADDDQDSVLVGESGV